MYQKEQGMSFVFWEIQPVTRRLWHQGEPVPMITQPSTTAHASWVAVRARTIIPLAGERPARGMAALTAPLVRMDNAVVVAVRGVIAAVEPYAVFRRRAGADVGTVTDLGDVVLTPGLVNCHTHLELSHLVGKTVLGQGFSPWVASLISCMASSREAALPAMQEAARRMALAGTATVGDITERMPADSLASLRAAGLTVRSFLELFGHDPARGGELAAAASMDAAFSLAGHALYSTDAPAMVLARQWCAARGLPFCLHLAEHEDELECLGSGTGALYDMLRCRVLPDDWRAPGLGPVAWAASLGLLGPGTLAVHCVRCDDADISLLAQSGCGVCLCPRSNAAIDVGHAPASQLAERGVLLVLGTDSLASNVDLDVWNEAEFFLQKNILPANALLRMATVNGAFVLRCLQQSGTLEKGKAFCYRIFPGGTNSLFR